MKKISYTKCALVFLILYLLPWLSLFVNIGSIPILVSIWEWLLLVSPLCLGLSIIFSIAAWVEARKKALIETEKNVSSGWKYILICSILLILLWIFFIWILGHMAV
jgi:hypothetical protein